jgi:hypothetical protein
MGKKVMLDSKIFGRAAGNVNAPGSDFSYSHYGQGPGNAGGFRDPQSLWVAFRGFARRFCLLPSAFTRGSHGGRMRVACGSQLYVSGLQVAWGGFA